MSEGLFLYINNADIESFKENKISYQDKVVFLGNSGKIIAKGKEYGGDENIIESISVNGVEEDIINKTIDINIPTKISDLINDAGFTNTNGTITEIRMNNASIGTSGTVDLGTVLTSIKTINGQSIVGTGNITIGTSSGGEGYDESSVHIHGNETIDGIKTFTGDTTTVIGPEGINVSNENTSIDINDGFTIYDDDNMWSKIRYNIGGVTISLSDVLSSKYVKPSNGIPKSDLDSTVATSLSKADTALQAHQQVKSINGNDLIGSGNVQVGTVKSIVLGDGLTGGTIVESGVIGLSMQICGSTTVNSVVSIPITHRAVLATISANATLSFASLPNDGYEVHVIIRNSGSSTITVTLPSTGSYVCTSEDTIYVSSQKYAEVNIITIGTTGFVHGISSI